MTDREMLEKMLGKIEGLEAGQQEIKEDVKYIREQVDILYNWVDRIDLDVKTLK